MKELIGVINAPWTTILMLASGYAAYFVAHVGVREHHQSIDQVFRVVFYGFWGMFAYAVAISSGLGMLSASAICMAFSVALGAAWRRLGKSLLGKIFRATRISMSDDIPTAWAALSDVGEDVNVSQLKVRLVDGTMMFCRDLSVFRQAPNGPCVLGGKGDVLMYVTDIGKKNAKNRTVWTPVSGVHDEYYGYSMTYIPREQVARVELRRSIR